MKKALIIGVILLLLIGFIFFFFFYNKSISSEKLRDGVYLNMKEGSSQNLMLKDEKHKVTATDIKNDDSVDFILESEPFLFNLRVGESKDLDWNLDFVYDFNARLDSINKQTGEIKFFLKEINKRVCNEKWICTNWYPCVYDITQRRGCPVGASGISAVEECYVGTEKRDCGDENNCGTTDYKPDLEQTCFVKVQNASMENESIIPDFTSCSNLNCFIDSADNCKLSNLTYTKTLNIFGLNITATHYYEIKGLDNGQCNFYLRLEEEHVNYTDELIQQSLDAGATIEEIRQQEQQTNVQMDLLEDKDGQCKTTSNGLANFLKTFEVGGSGGVSCSQNTQGDYDCSYSGDWAIFNSCEGEYFTPPEY